MLLWQLLLPLLLLLLLLLLHLLLSSKALVHHGHHPHRHHQLRAHAGLRSRERSGDRLCLRELHLQLLVLHLGLLAHVRGQHAVGLQRELEVMDLRLQLRDIVHDHLGYGQVCGHLFLRVQAGLEVVGGLSLCAHMSVS